MMKLIILHFPQNVVNALLSCPITSSAFPNKEGFTLTPDFFFSSSLLVLVWHSSPFHLSSSSCLQPYFLAILLTRSSSPQTNDYSLRCFALFCLQGFAGPVLSTGSTFPVKKTFPDSSSGSSLPSSDSAKLFLSVLPCAALTKPQSQDLLSNLISRWCLTTTPQDLRVLEGF